MGKRTVARCWVGDYLVEASADEPISKPEWGELMAEIASRREHMQGVVVLAGATPPTATQRAELTEALAGASVHAAILTDSPVVRLALTAINFFVRGPGRAFAPDKIEDALAYLKVPSALVPEIRAALVRLKAELDAGG
jgi:hypothetical protein